MAVNMHNYWTSGMWHGINGTRILADRNRIKTKDAGYDT
jgi:hypothetical protein